MTYRNINFILFSWIHVTIATKVSYSLSIIGDLRDWQLTSAALTPHSRAAMTMPVMTSTLYMLRTSPSICAPLLGTNSWRQRSRGRNRLCDCKFEVIQWIIQYARHKVFSVTIVMQCWQINARQLLPAILNNDILQQLMLAINCSKTVTCKASPEA